MGLYLAAQTNISNLQAVILTNQWCKLLLYHKITEQQPPKILSYANKQRAGALGFLGGVVFAFVVERRRREAFREKGGTLPLTVAGVRVAD